MAQENKLYKFLYFVFTAIFVLSLLVASLTLFVFLELHFVTNDYLLKFVENQQFAEILPVLKSPVMFLIMIGLSVLYCYLFYIMMLFFKNLKLNRIFVSENVRFCKRMVYLIVGINLIRMVGGIQFWEYQFVDMTRVFDVSSYVIILLFWAFATIMENATKTIALDGK